VPSLQRLWQMLLKGLGEVEQAPDRHAAGEMILVRLCHVAELPPPGDLVQKLSGAARGEFSRPAAPVAASRGANAVALQPRSAAPPRMSPRAVPSSLRDIAMLAATRREPQLHAHLLHSVHLVRIASNVIELRLEAGAPRDLAAKLATLLLEATGERWTIALSAAAGEPTLAEQDAARAAARRQSASLHPLVRSILDAFPGAVVEPLRAPPAPTETETEAAPPPAEADILDEE